jgi:hypothetical protein
MTKKKSDMGTRQKKRNLKKFIRQNTERTERRQAAKGWHQGGRKSGENHSKPLTGTSRVPSHVITKIKKGTKIKKIRVDDYPPFLVFEDDE